MMRTASGMVGDTFVFRRWRGKQIVANRPKPREEGGPSARQLEIQEKFANASAYAKQVISNPATKALYETGIGGTLYTAYMVAMSDYLNAPKVLDIDATGYKGVVGDEILIKATDDFKVTTVRVDLTNAAGALIESGSAVQDPIIRQLWHYVATVANQGVSGSAVKATAIDTPGNKGFLDKVL